MADRPDGNASLFCSSRILCSVVFFTGCNRQQHTVIGRGFLSWVGTSEESRAGSCLLGLRGPCRHVQGSRGVVGRMFIAEVGVITAEMGCYFCGSYFALSTVYAGSSFWPTSASDNLVIQDRSTPRLNSSSGRSSSAQSCSDVLAAADLRVKIRNQFHFHPDRVRVSLAHLFIREVGT